MQVILVSFFSLDREIKMPRNQYFCSNREIFMPRKFHAIKYAPPKIGSLSKIFYKFQTTTFRELDSWTKLVFINLGTRPLSGKSDFQPLKF